MAYLTCAQFDALSHAEKSAYMGSVGHTIAEQYDMTKKDRWIPNQYYSKLRTVPAIDALLCVLLELRVGGILEDMQLESVTDSPTIPNMCGTVIAFRRSDGTQFAINTSDALTVWDDEDAWHAETDGDMICARVQEELARMVTSIPLNRATPLEPLESTKQ